MKDALTLTLDEHENRRKAYRTPVDEKVSMTIAGDAVVLLDISETGVAFETDQNFSGMIENALIFFTLKKNCRLKPTLKVTFCSSGRCGAEFVGLSQRAHLALSELIVDIQKARIRQQREERFSEEGL
jgi:hypothetical protein